LDNSRLGKEFKKGQQQAISRILFPEGITPHGAAIIHLGHSLLNGSSDLPGRLWRATISRLEIEM
jgi:hypothetical protein